MRGNCEIGDKQYIEYVVYVIIIKNVDFLQIKHNEVAESVRIYNIKNCDS